MPSPPPPRAFDTGLRPADVDAERPHFLETPWGPMALFDLDGEYRCVQAFCPHLEGPLFQGTRSGDSITCPWHGWRYDLRTCKRIDPARPLFGPGREPLVSCGVTTGPAGTIVLGPPHGAS